MTTASLTLIFLIIVTFSAAIPGVRNTTHIGDNATTFEKIWYYLKKHKKFIGIAAGFLGAITGYLASVEQNVDQNLIKSKSDTLQYILREKAAHIITLQNKLEVSKIKSDAQQNELYKQQKELYVQQKALTDSTSIIANLNRQLADSQKEIARLAIETTNNVIGGDSYCLIKIFPISSDSAQVTLVHKGLYPLTDLRISIERETVKNALAMKLDSGNITLKKYFDDISSFSTIFKKGSLPVGNNHEWKTAYVLGYVPFKHLKNEIYCIYFYARNGVWTENYKFTYNDKGELRTSYVVGRPPIKGRETKYVVFEEKEDYLKP